MKNPHIKAHLQKDILEKENIRKNIPWVKRMKISGKGNKLHAKKFQKKKEKKPKFWRGKT